MLYYAMALWRIGNQVDAGGVPGGVQLDAMKLRTDRLVRLRAEAAALLGLKEPQSHKETPAPKP
jgi:hypothetical protein